MTPLNRAAALAFLTAFLLVHGCSDADAPRASREDGSAVPKQGVDARDPVGGAGGALGHPPFASSPADGLGLASGSAGGPTGCVPQPETCNGSDDDCNGIIDDLDSDSDGVCDCIRIATLGKPGTWGKGGVFGAWLAARASDGAKDLGAQEITEAILRGFQILVVQDVREVHMGRVFSPEEVAALETWVRAGGGLMTLIGFADATEMANVNLLLAPFGMRYLPTRIAVGLGTLTVPIKSFPAQHPLTAGVKAVGANNGYKVGGAGTAYAMWNDSVIGLANEVDKGRIDMWGDEWITYDSEWTRHTDYQVELFWVNTIKWLTPVSVCQVAIPPDLIIL